MTDTHDAGDGGRSTDVPLLDETIGANLARTVAAHGAARRWSRATRACAGPTASSASGSSASRGLMALGLEPGDRVGLWSPNYAEWTLVQYATAEIGVILVNINPAYRTHELAYVLDQSGCRMLIAAPAFKTSDYVAMVDAGRGPSCPASSGRSSSGTTTGTSSSPATGGATDDALDARGARRSRPTTRSTSSTRRARPGSRRAPRSRHRNILNNGYFVTAPAAASRRTTGCASRCPSTTASGW